MLQIQMKTTMALSLIVQKIKASNMKILTRIAKVILIVNHLQKNYFHHLIDQQKSIQMSTTPARSGTSALSYPTKSTYILQILNYLLHFWSMICKGRN